VPLVAGISATPARFDRLIEGTGRTARRVDVGPEKVRESGLLKEIVTLYHPREAQHSDMTMLRAAARSWRDFDDQWVDYCQREDEPQVRPILVIQVQDGTKAQVSRTDIAAAIDAIEAETEGLPARAYAHAFQEGDDLEMGGRRLRYLAPADVDADPGTTVAWSGLTGGPPRRVVATGLAALLYDLAGFDVLQVVLE
jgi:type III restriction enzyme